MKITYIPRKRDQRKKRVAAYCRVSTSLDNQEDSFEAQLGYYESYIMRHPEWEFAGIYSDEKSATKVNNRPGFQRMVNDALKGEADLILVKSISRFSRNIVDFQNYVQLLYFGGVYVFFEEEGIDTSDPSSSMMFSLLSAIAQDESRSISENVKWGYRERFRRGQYNLGNNRILGYDSVDGKLIPNQDAWIVERIFQLFLEGKTYTRIADRIDSEGGRSLRSGGRMSSSSILYILRNETYVGDKLLQKHAPINFLTKVPQKDLEFESTYLRDDHEAIIDRKTWNAVQTILNQRQKDRKSGSGKKYRNGHFLYGKIICGKCGAACTRRTQQEYARDAEGKSVTYKQWMCSEHRKGRKGNGCRNRRIRESDLLEGISSQLGWSRNGTDFFDEVLFQKLVKHVKIHEDRVTVVRQ